MLKLPFPHADEERGGRALAHFGPRAAARCLARHGPNLLLERLAPGTSLTERVAAGDDAGATAILARVMAALHRAGPAPAGYPSVEDWADGFRRVAASGGHPLLPAELLAEAAATWSRLAAGQRRRVLLHGDLHHDNVLWDARRGWVVIDPKGIVGETAFEPGAALRNPADHAWAWTEPDAIAGRAGCFASMLGCPLDRILAWAWTQAVLSACWSVEDGEGPAEIGRALRFAAAIRPLLAA